MILFYCVWERIRDRTRGRPGGESPPRKPIFKDISPWGDEKRHFTSQRIAAEMNGIEHRTEAL